LIPKALAEEEFEIAIDAWSHQCSVTFFNVYLNNECPEGRDEDANKEGCVCGYSFDEEN